MKSERKKALYASIFNRVAADFDRVGPEFFAKFGRRLVEQADIASGAKALDVAAGRGAILFPAAEQAGPEGSVIGIDFAEAMVGQTSEEIIRRGVRNAEMRQMDAEQLDFPAATFDFVLCGFAVNFFPQPERAFAEFYRVLKPGGRAITSLIAENEHYRWYTELLGKYLRQQAGQPEPEQPSPNSAPSLEEMMMGWMTSAGFVDAQIRIEDNELIFADEEEWWNWLWSQGMRTALEQLKPEKLDEFKAEAFAGLQAIKQPDGFHYRFPVQFTFGTRPVRTSRKISSE